MTHDDRANRYVGPPRVAADGAVYVWCPNPPDGTRCKSETCIKTQKCQKGVPMPHAKDANHREVCMTEQPDKAETPIVDAVAAECRKALGIGVAIGNAHGMGLIIGKCVENLLDVACDLELKLAAAEQRLAIHALAMNTGGIEELHARAEQAEQRAEEMRRERDEDGLRAELKTVRAGFASEFANNCKLQHDFDEMQLRVVRAESRLREVEQERDEARKTDANEALNLMHSFQSKLEVSQSRLRAVEAALREVERVVELACKDVTAMAGSDDVDIVVVLQRWLESLDDIARLALSTPQEEKKS